MGVFGQNLQQAMEERNITAKAFSSNILHVDPSTLGKYIKGTRKMPRQAMRQAIEQLDDPFIALAAQDEVTGGASVPYLNGSHADLNKGITHLKTIEEVDEAREALSRIPITKRREQLTEQDKAAIRAAIMECIEAITALTMHVAILCKEYCFSWLGLWREHRKELKSKKYIA
ncbi:helix-turn-helix domain-containing protein [Gorillibacterium sp. sgz5001074]|uniref:helix-turn-helix domain-containing protein n=1 Tax=Gorillibacterium sp. sgz5001074 TaxID=3446695 RepID=UPI003F66CE0D